MQGQQHRRERDESNHLFSCSVHGMIGCASYQSDHSVGVFDRDSIFCQCDTFAGQHQESIVHWSDRTCDMMCRCWDYEYMFDIQSLES